jgi:nickel-dependent lactate racemase
MPEVTAPWGDGEMKILLPEHWKLQQVARASLPPAGENWPDRLAEALSQPTGELSLTQLLAARRDGKIVLVVEDMTRHSPLEAILNLVFREIEHAQIAAENVEIVFATGMHQPMTAEQASSKLGRHAQAFRWRCNPWHDRREYVHLGNVGKTPVLVDRGVAEAGLRIIISSVSPHLQAGFGGGYKMILPGCAHIETIRELHRLGLDRRARQLVGTEADRNEMRTAIDRGGQLLDSSGGKSFAIQYVLDDADMPTFLAVGEVCAVQQMLAKRCSAACGVIIEQPADVLVVNAFPRDFDLWQSFKCIPNTRFAARRNGVIICLARCEAGMEGMKVPRWSISGGLARWVVRLFGGETLAALMMRLAPSLAGDAAFFIRLALQTIHRNTVLMVSPALAALGKPFPGLTVYADVQQAIAAAARILGPGSQRVIVFPAGGITFPVQAAQPTPQDNGRVR